MKEESLAGLTLPVASHYYVQKMRRHDFASLGLGLWQEGRYSTLIERL